MGYVHPEKEVRSAAKTAEEKLETFGVEMVFRVTLNAAIQEYADTDEAAGLEGERLVEFTLRDLRHAGHELSPEAGPGSRRGHNGWSSSGSVSRRTSTNGKTHSRRSRGLDGLPRASPSRWRPTRRPASSR